ncbi:hypothetical protein [Dyadobacter sp. OTU695]|uniref:hypothetical protein n=1 Tax=Dyadobacter sp. OTU695 TaxID=3043860 RepID=UPI00313F2C72
MKARSSLRMKGTNVRALAIWNDKANKKNVEYMPVKAKAGRRGEYHNPNSSLSCPGF